MAATRSSCSPTCCRPAGSTSSQRELERFRLAMEQDPTTKAIAQYSKAEERFGADGGYRAEADVYRILAGLGLPADSCDVHHWGALGWRATSRRAGAHPLRRHRQPHPRRTHQPPRRRRQALAHGLPAVVSRHAARGEPRPRAARPGDHSRAARRRRRPPRVQGHLHAVRRVPCARRGTPHQAGGASRSRDRSTVDPRRQGAPLQRQAGEAGQEPRQARRPAGVRPGHTDPEGPHRPLPLPRTAALRA